jgi:hypothetical protein
MWIVKPYLLDDILLVEYLINFEGCTALKFKLGVEENICDLFCGAIFKLVKDLPNIINPH